jgi:hypothetical protein
MDVDTVIIIYGRSDKIISTDLWRVYEDLRRVYLTNADLGTAAIEEILL